VDHGHVAPTRRDRVALLRAGALLASIAMRSVVLACALAACAYKPGSYSYLKQGFAGHRVTIGCLDLAIVRRPDTPDGAVVEYQFGNRCEHPSPVVIPVVATGRTPGGKDRELFAFDPNGEIRPLTIDGRSYGNETIEYRADDDYGTVEICIDAAAIARETPTQRVCLGDAPADSTP
jgi:hypothetical protein